MTWLDSRKTCIRCGAELPIEAFSFARANLEDGRQDVCSGCLDSIRWPRRTVTTSQETNHQ
jgi:hypothetical protein